MNEAKIHENIIKHIRFRKVRNSVTLHINNTPRSARDGCRLQRMGMLKGAPDLVHHINGQTIYHEIKTERGGLSDDQIKVHGMLQDAGIRVIVTYGLSHALGELQRIGVIK